MLENNWKTWIVLIIAFAGASVELIKHLPGGPAPTAWQKENVRLGMNGKPYSVRELPKKMRLPVRPAAVHVAGDSKVLGEALKAYNASVTPTATEIKHDNAPAKKTADNKKKKKDKNDDEYEIVVDPVTGKKVKRKKKKDTAKKEEKTKTPVAATETEPPAEEPPAEPTDAQTIAAAISEIANTGDLPQPIKKTADAFMSLAEWERLLLNRPDLGQTKAFIQAFRNHTVSSDIYYKITKMMIADSRADMKSLGVLCAGSAPSVLSFQTLAGVASGGSADLKANAMKFINSYSTSLSNLTILQGVLRGSDTRASTLALQQLDAAANRFLVSSATPNPGTQNNRSNNAAQFKQFLPILTQLASSGDATLASQAHQSLTNLENLLGPSNSNIAQAQ